MWGPHVLVDEEGMNENGMSEEGNKRKRKERKERMAYYVGPYDDIFV